MAKKSQGNFGGVKVNIIFMRHGEATDNVKELISDKEIYWSILTEDGKKTVLESIKTLPSKIDKIYVSPFPRTMQTAHMVLEKYSKVETVIEQRLHEITYGKYSGQKNNDELDKTRLKQIDGDYFVRFGQYGENKFDIESRLCEFLQDVYKNNFHFNTIMIISHGSITSYMKRILNLKTPHIKTGKVEEFINVDFSLLFKHIKKLKDIKLQEINKRIKTVKELDVNEKLKNNLIKMVKKEFNNIEFSDIYFENFINGIKTKNLKQKKVSDFDDGIIAVCFYNDFENFAEKWMRHYIDIGVKNFVLVDNNSSDNSTKILKNYEKEVNISFWEIKEKYNCYKMCGWKQQILEYYGVGRKYLIVDSDELFIYEDYRKISLSQFTEKNKLQFIKSMMLDVYTNKNIFEGTLGDFNFVDKETYKMTTNVSYKQRFYGGPRSRIFGINPSLQKIPFILYSGQEILANDHYYYPWNINDKAKYRSYLLHYKFLPGDEKKYNVFARDGRHWNNSHEYKIYNNVLSNNKVSFYDKDISVNIDRIDFRF